MMARALFCLLVAGALIRLALFPLPFGDDFADWMLDLENIFRGGFLYHYPLPVDGKFLMNGLEYNYTPFWKPPFFIYLMIPLEYLSAYTGVSMFFLAKLVFLLSDLAVSYLLYSLLSAKGATEKKALMGMSLFLFNPLVVYLSSVVGKFDSLVLLFLLLALRNVGRARFSLYYGVSFATKPFTLLILPWFLFRNRALKRFIILSFAVFLFILLPYLIYDYRFLGDIFFPHYSKTPRGFSWMIILGLFESGTVRALTSVFFGLYLISLVAIAWLFESSVYAYSALAFTLFVVFNKVLWEQYLIWGIPFLAALYVLNKSRMALVLIFAYSAAGVMYNSHVQLFDEVRLVAVNFCLLALTIIFLGSVMLSKGFRLKRVLD